jgi:phosphatidylglycerophosphatase A
MTEPPPATGQRPPLLVRGVATVGGIGHIGFAPGTFGSIAALVPIWLFSSSMPGVFPGRSVPFALAILAFVIGWWASEVYVRGSRVADPSEIVIDEVSGQSLTLVFAPAPIGSWWIVGGFLAFRFFDILKPWPVGLAERRLKGGLGVMADDTLAAIYAGLVLLLARWIVGA